MNESRTYRVLADVREFLGQTFAMSKTMVEEISLPLYARNLGSNPFVIAHQLRKRVTSINTD